MVSKYKFDILYLSKEKAENLIKKNGTEGFLHYCNSLKRGDGNKVKVVVIDSTMTPEEYLVRRSKEGNR
jgi:hypothetical protein